VYVEWPADLVYFGLVVHALFLFTLVHHWFNSIGKACVLGTLFTLVRHWLDSIGKSHVLGICMFYVVGLALFALVWVNSGLVGCLVCLFVTHLIKRTAPAYSLAW
jgi:hypothetical protein